MNRVPRLNIMGIDVDPVTMDQAVDAVAQFLASDEVHQQVSVNASKFVLMHDDAELREFVRDASLVCADGIGVVLAARLLGRSVPTRLPGIDLFHALMARAAEQGWKPYFLGATEETIQEAAQRLTAKYPGLEIAGLRNGYFSDDEEASVAEEIRATGADMLFVGIPSPKKELFLKRRLHDTGVRFAMGVGGTFDVVAGKVHRAPSRVQKLGLEWAFRLAQEPRTRAPWMPRRLATFVGRVGLARLGLYVIPDDG